MSDLQSSSETCTENALILRTNLFEQANAITVYEINI